MTIAQRNRSDQTISRPLEAVSGYLDAAGAFAGDRLADLLSRQQLIRALAHGVNGRTDRRHAQSSSGAAAGPTRDESTEGH